MKKCALTLWIFIVVAVSTNVDAINSNTDNMKTHIIIEFKSEGGIAFIPALNQPAIIDSNHLSKAQLDELRHLIEKAKFFELPENMATSSKGAADYQNYTITIEEEGRQHRVDFTDLVDNPALKKLFAFLKSVRSVKK